MAKHRSKRVRKFVKKASIAGGVAVTATTLTLGLAPPSSAALLDDQDATQALGALGLDLPALPPLTDIPGVKIITTGPPFGLLGIIGVNPFWVPALPSRIADEINSTSYIDIDTSIPVPVGALTGQLKLDLGNIRIPVVLGFGIGSLAAGMAYPDVEADLPNQPGGTADGAEPGSSLTIVPMLLIRNPGRNDGGVAARFAPFFEIFGLDTATNDFDVQTDGDAVLVPIKVDLGVQNDPLSDFAAWPNPVTLANNAAAFAFPTYILRGSDLSGIGLATLNPLVASLAGNAASAVIDDGVTVDMPGIVPDVHLSRDAAIGLLTPILNDALASTFPGIDITIPNGADLADRFEALNLYLTLENGAQPVLEPFRYPTDVLSLMTGQTITNPFADAIEPAITMLGNLGYTNVVQYGADPNDFRDDYQRDFSDNFGSNGGEAMPFFSLPENIDWDAVPEDLVKALAGGIQDAFFYGGIPGVNHPPPSQHDNPLGLLANLVEQLLGSTDLGSLTDLESVSPLAANNALDQNAETMTVNADAAIDSATPPPSDTTEDGASADALAAADDDTTDRQRPRLNVWRNGLNPLASASGSTTDGGSSGKGPLRQAISDTRQQIRDSVGDFTKAVSNVTKNVTKAVTGGGDDDDNDNDAPDGGDTE